MTLEFGDVVFVKGLVTGWREWRKWMVSWCIRFMSRSKGEAPTFTNHVAMVIGRQGDDYQLAEALGKRGFVYTHLRERYSDTRRFEVCIARHRRLNADHRARMWKRCEHLHGKKYGQAKIVAHAVDFALTALWNASGGSGDVYAFRWLCRMENYPICSWAVADIYWHAGLPFKKAVAVAQPDDIYDECKASQLWVWVVDAMEDVT